MRIRQTIAGLGWALALLAPGAGTHAATVTLDEALQAAARNLDVSIAARSAAAAQADVLAADHAPLPQLSGKLSQIDLQNGIGPGNLLRDKRIDKGLGIDWTWERGDKRALRTEAARRAAAAAGADVDEVRLQQMLAAHAAFFDLLAAQERLAEVRDIEAGTQQLASTATRRLQAGDLAQQDAARAAIEAQRAGADTQAARQDVQRARLGLALQTGLPEAELVAATQWPAAPALEAEIALPADLLEQRADVRAAAERVRAAEAALGSARALRSSDVTWGASIDHIPGTSTRQVELRAQMPLSWGYRYEGESSRAQAQLEQARDQLEKTRRAAASELRRLRSDMVSAEARERSYRQDIVPRSREVLQRAETAYARGALPLTDLLDARRTLRATLLEALAVRAELAKAVGAWQLRTRVDAGTSTASSAGTSATERLPKTTP
jgi:cobalt-zinc-cadmium efflux system outer membrane protein